MCRLRGQNGVSFCDVLDRVLYGKSGSILFFMVVQVGFGRVRFRSFPCCSYSALDRVRLLCVTVEYFLIVSGASLHDQVCLKERVDGSLFLNESGLLRAGEGRRW